MRETVVRLQAMDRAGRGIALDAVPARTLTVILFLLAFAFQSFVAQTHIHIPRSVDGVSAIASGAGSAKPNRAPDQPLQDDLNKCPLCQVAMAVGVAAGPASFYFDQPILAAIAALLHVVPRPQSASPAHVWNSRAPPLR